MAFTWVDDEGLNASLMKAATVQFKIVPIVLRYSELIKNRIVTTMSSPKHGLMWKSLGRSGKASAPGEGACNSGW